MSSLKQQILAGIKRTEKLHVPEWEHDRFDGWVEIRPLTDGEQAEVESFTLAGQKMRGEAGSRATQAEVDLAASTKGMREARRVGAAYGLSVAEERWNARDLKDLPPAGVKRVFDAVMELTGGGGIEDDAARFLADQRGEDDSDPASDGEPADDDAG